MMTPDNANIPDILKKDFIVEKGDAEGVDFSLKYASANFSIWAVYSLGYFTGSMI